MIRSRSEIRKGAAMLLMFCVTGAFANVTAASANRSRVIDLHQIGALAITGTTSYRQAVDVFGSIRRGHASATFTTDWCHLRYPRIGLAFDFAPLGLESATPKSCRGFFGATVTSSTWRTVRGLSVGLSETRMLGLYPRAWKTGLGPTVGAPLRSTQWWLKQAPGLGRQPVLVAYVRSGRVVALGINIVGH